MMCHPYIEVMSNMIMWLQMKVRIYALLKKGVKTLQINEPFSYFQAMYSFCQLMTASMPTIIGRNITAYRPTHDCFYTNLDHIMTAYLPTLGLIA